MTTIRILGSGDAFGSGGRFNSCLMLDCDDGPSMLLDCGASSLVALNRSGVDLNGISTILLTHFNGDHLAGLTFFVLQEQFVSKLTTPLLVAGPPGIAERARTVMEALFPGSFAASRVFDLAFQEVAPGRPAMLNGFAATAFPVVHDERAGPCQGYRLEKGGKVFAFSGDTGWTDALIPLAAGAEILLLECYLHARKLPSHLDWLTIAERWADLGAKRIIITHMGEDMLAFDGPLPAERAHDGMVLTL